MKVSRLYQNFHRSALEFFRFQRKTTRVRCCVTLGGNAQRRRGSSLGCFSASSCFVREIVCKLKNRWRQGLGWHKSNSSAHYSYDLRSYCLNFDEAPSQHHHHIHKPLPLCTK